MLNKLQKIIFIVIFLSIFTGCLGDSYKESFYPITEVKKTNNKYDTKNFAVNENPSLEISNSAGNIEIYGWKESNIKIEINNYNKSIGVNKTEDIYECFIENNKVTFRCNELIENNLLYENRIDLVIYVPRSLENLSMSLDKCNLTIYDRINTNMNTTILDGNMLLKSFKGVVTANIKHGNSTFESTSLNGKNRVYLEKGNIKFSGTIETDDNSEFITEYGNIKIAIQSTKTIPVFECEGAVETNKFTNQVISKKEEQKSIVIKCNGGHIDLEEII